MYDDIEFRNTAVREELKKWGEWYLNVVHFDGVRLDAVKHISPKFYNEWLDHLRNIKPDLFAVGEYWAPGKLPLLAKYIDATEGKMSLFDASLHHNLCAASLAGNSYNLSEIFNETLVSVKPLLAVTVVDNHDTQPLQSLEAPVEKWFKPLAYALILLREAGYPCVFYPDLYGAHIIPTRARMATIMKFSWMYVRTWTSFLSPGSDMPMALKEIILITQIVWAGQGKVQTKI